MVEYNTAMSNIAEFKEQLIPSFNKLLRLSHYVSALVSFLAALEAMNVLFFVYFENRTILMVNDIMFIFTVLLKIHTCKTACLEHNSFETFVGNRLKTKELWVCIISFIHIPYAFYYLFDEVKDLMLLSIQMQILRVFIIYKTFGLLKILKL